MVGLSKLFGLNYVINHYVAVFCDCTNFVKSSWINMLMLVGDGDGIVLDLDLLKLMVRLD